jgi:hypothetical protein
MRTQFILHLTDGEEPELLRTEFYHPAYARDGRRTVRGKDEGAHQADGTFQWSAAVKVLVAYLLRCAAWARACPIRNPGERCPVLEGGRSSPAASLNFALSKQNAWICDMFGSDAHGRPHLVADLMLRSNADLKRKREPVVLRLNPITLPPRQIEVMVGGKLLEKPDEIERLAAAIEASWQRKVSGLTCVVLTLRGSVAGDWTLEKRREVERALHALGIKNCNIVTVEEGSIKLTLKLANEDAERLFWAVHSGELDELGVVDSYYVREHHEASQLGVPEKFFFALRPAAAHNTPNHHPGGSPLKTRQIRPSVWSLPLIALNGLVLLAAGAAIWFLWPLPRQTARTQLHIPLDIPNTLQRPDTHLSGEAFLKNQAYIIKDRFVLNAALNNEKVAKLEVLKEQPDQLLWLENEIKVTFPGPEFIQISMSGERPDQLLVIINAVRKAYLEKTGDKELADREIQLKTLKDIRDDWEKRSKLNRKKMRDLQEKIGAVDPPNLALVQKVVLEELDGAQKDLVRVRSQLREFRVEIGLHPEWLEAFWPQYVVTLSSVAALSPAPAPTLPVNFALIGLLHNEFLVSGRQVGDDIEELLASDPRIGPAIQRIQILEMNIEGYRKVARGDKLEKLIRPALEELEALRNQVNNFAKKKGQRAIEKAIGEDIKELLASDPIIGPEIQRIQVLEMNIEGYRKIARGAQFERLTRPAREELERLKNHVNEYAKKKGKRALEKTKNGQGVTLRERYLMAKMLERTLVEEIQKLDEMTTNKNKQFVDLAELKDEIDKAEEILKSAHRKIDAIEIEQKAPPRVWEFGEGSIYTPPTALRARVAVSVTLAALGLLLLTFAGYRFHAPKPARNGEAEAESGRVPD